MISVGIESSWSLLDLKLEDHRIQCCWQRCDICLVQFLACLVSGMKTSCKYEKKSRDEDVLHGQPHHE